jgi:hypothetical protein
VCQGRKRGTNDTSVMPKAVKKRGERLRRRTRESAPSPPATFESPVHNELAIIPEDCIALYDVTDCRASVAALFGESASCGRRVGVTSCTVGR